MKHYLTHVFVVYDTVIHNSTYFFSFCDIEIGIKQANKMKHYE